MTRAFSAFAAVTFVVRISSILLLLLLPPGSSTSWVYVGALLLPLRRRAREGFVCEC